MCLSGTLEEKLAAIAAAGFDGFELFEPDLVTSWLSPADVRSRAADLGLSIELYQPFRDFEQVDDDQLRANVHRLRRKLDLMAELGVSTLLMCSNVDTAVDDSDARAVDQLGIAAREAADRGISIAYEALAWGRSVSTVDHAWALVRQVDHPALGVCVDSFHILSRGTDPAVLDDIPGEKILFCQLADAPRLQLDVLNWSRHHRVFPGEGDWDLADFVARVIAIGYRGPLSLEVFNDTFRQTSPERTAMDAYRSLVATEGAAFERLGSTSGELPPDRAQRMGFIELAPDSDGRLKAALDALGFERHGAHRRKAVDLYESGNARLIVNRAEAGPRARIRALGFEVEDVAAATDRALALGCEVLPRDHADGEAILNAVSAPNGAEIYFAPRAESGFDWAAEFTLTNDGPQVFHEVDHVVMEQSWQRIDEAKLFYESILGLSVQASSDVPGPDGLVRSLALKGPGGIRVALNVRPLEAAGRPGFADHIALGTDDVLRLAERLADSGVATLPVPDNYYADLDARFRLEPERLERFRRFGILYDRDDSGEFLQLFTAPIDDVVIEIVQRDRDYLGYGAANAPIRLAAQRLLASGGVASAA
ncbi:bifunctional sugar phosphate isomerase/epimerase/4-hydroxyphenylpyruvate dioxygenase family protein [Gryllotalpicola koreensis]|uniref:3-dehydroshikimate dehydratase n=1 Tax=Gryllotalpicola koreensis TaxID=993086 RepID=A0ABP8A2G4_9MICO